MAVYNGCSGQELIQTIDDLDKRDAEQNKQACSKFAELTADGFCVGDVRDSTRTDLGDKYLLCNGDDIYSWDGHEKLIEILQNIGNTCYTSSIDGVTASFSTLLIVDDIIFVFDLNNRKVVLKKFLSCQNLICNNYEYQEIYDCSDLCTSGGLSNLKVVFFQNRFFIRFTYNAGDMAVIVSVDKDFEETPTILYSLNCSSINFNYCVFDMVSTSNSLIIMSTDSSLWNDTSNTVNIMETTDGLNFTTTAGAFKFDSDLRYGSTFAIQNSYFFYMMSDNYNYYFGTESFRGDYGSGGEGTGKCFYCDNYYWRLYGNKLRRGSSVQSAFTSGTTVLSDVSDVVTYGSSFLVIQGNKLYLYDMATNSFNELSYSNTLEENIQYGLFGKSFYTHKTNDAFYRIEDGLHALPKTETVTQLPTITSDKMYHYIKVKE